MPNCLGYLENELGTNDYLVGNTFTLGTRSAKVQTLATDNGAAQLVRFIQGLRGADRIARPYASSGRACMILI
jgi:hypothetical protein